MNFGCPCEFWCLCGAFWELEFFWVFGRFVFEYGEAECS